MIVKGPVLLIKKDAMWGVKRGVALHACAGEHVFYDCINVDGSLCLVLDTLGRLHLAKPEHIEGWGEGGLGLPFDWPDRPTPTTDWPAAPDKRMEAPCRICKRPNDTNHYNQFVHVNCWSCGQALVP